MKNKVPIQIKYLLSAVLVVVLIGSMFYRALPRWDVCYTADFPGMHVELYPQRSVSNEYDIYRDFILRLNDTSMRKNWEWKAGIDEIGITAPFIYSVDLNNDQQKELIFVFRDGIQNSGFVHLETIHILDIYGKEHSVENPWYYLEKELQSNLTFTEKEVLLNISFGQKYWQLRYSNVIFPDLETLDSQIGYLPQVSYQITDDTLSADIPFIVYFGFILGYFHLQYEEIDGSYIITDVRIEQLPKEEL